MPPAPPSGEPNIWSLNLPRESTGVTWRFLARGRLVFGLVSIFLIVVVATAASGHGPLTTLNHPQEGICCHYSAFIDVSCTGGWQAQITAVAQNFDNKNHTMTISIRNYTTAEWASSSHPFVASGTWSLKRPWRIDYGRSEESPWHTFTDSFGAKTSMWIACVP